MRPDFSVCGAYLSPVDTDDDLIIVDLFYEVFHGGRPPEGFGRIRRRYYNVVADNIVDPGTGWAGTP